MDNETIKTTEDIKDTYRRLIQSGIAASDVLYVLAQDLEHPRAFEVYARLLSETANITDKLGKIIERETTSGESDSNNETLKMTPSELQKMLSD